MTPVLLVTLLSSLPAELAPLPRPAVAGRIEATSGNSALGQRAVLYAPPPAEPKRVGRILLVGNSRTRDAAILKLVPFTPGQPLPPAVDLEKLERKLLVRFAGRFDLDAGRWPTVRVLPGDSTFRDVEVSFPDHPVPGRLALPPPQLPAPR